jgi:hypothetical protein
VVGLLAVSSLISSVYADGDPLERNKSFFEICTSHNYFCEKEDVTMTQNGFILPLWRIRASDTGPKKPPILFVPQLLITAIDLIYNGKDGSLPFKAVDEGYDVFIMDLRCGENGLTTSTIMTQK